MAMLHLASVKPESAVLVAGRVSVNLSLSYSLIYEPVNLRKLFLPFGPCLCVVYWHRATHRPIPPSQLQIDNNTHAAPNSPRRRVVLRVHQPGSTTSELILAN
jgi:CBS-domain-containing membrane protein